MRACSFTPTQNSKPKLARVCIRPFSFTPAHLKPPAALSSSLGFNSLQNCSTFYLFVRFEVEHGDVHKSIIHILSQHHDHDGAWMTFRQIPRDKLARMFECFRTRWSWDPANEQLIHEGFINVLKKCYRDIMRQLRIDSTMLACAAHEDMDPNNYLQFDKIRDFPPPAISLEVWRELCKDAFANFHVGTQKVGLISPRMGKNRRSADSSAKSSRHMGGSMGYAERRARMKRKMNEEPNFKRIFLDTYLTKECKQQCGTWDGDIDIYNLEELKFCTEQAKKVYGGYLSAMREVYGPNYSEFPDDPEVWARVVGQGRTRRVYEIGSLDLEYLVTGTSSSSVGSARLQVQVMRTQMVDLEARLEEERNLLTTRLDEERKAVEELQQLQKFMNNWRPPSN
ncbi:hypothetical protein Hanom_Chr10g00894681 [Helianthus anomalus]